MAEVNNSLALGIKPFEMDIGKTLGQAAQINSLRANTAQTEQETQYRQFQQNRDKNGLRVGEANTEAETNLKQTDLRGRAANEIVQDPSDAGVQSAFRHFEQAGAPLDSLTKQKILAMPPEQRRQTALQIQQGSMPSSTSIEQKPAAIGQRSYMGAAGGVAGGIGGDLPPVPSVPAMQPHPMNAPIRTNPDGSIQGNIATQPAAPVTSRINPLRQKGLTEAQNVESSANAAQNSAEFTRYKVASDNASSTKNSLRQIIDDSDRAYTGPGAERSAAARRALYGLTQLPGVGPTIKSMIGDQSDPVAALENIRKNVGIISRQAVGEIGERSNAALESVQRSIPTEVTSHKGILQAANQFMALQDFAQARTIEATKWLKDRGSLDGFAADWTKNMGPATFVMARLPREEQIAVRKRMSATPEGKRSLDQIDKQIDWAKDRGLGSVID